MMPSSLKKEVGLEYKNFTENNDAQTQNVILQNLEISLEAVEIIFGIDLVQVFIDSPYVELLAAERIQMSKEGFLLPTVRIRDASVGQLAEQVCADIETPDNIAVYLAHRQ